jgi:hypothetical protein
MAEHSAAERRDGCAGDDFVVERDRVGPATLAQRVGDHVLEVMERTEGCELEGLKRAATVNASQNTYRVSFRCPLRRHGTGRHLSESGLTEEDRSHT